MEQPSLVKDTRNSEIKQQDAKVMVGIPTGYPKLYSTYYMIAALANLDYDNLEIHWAVTGCEDPHYDEFRQRLSKLIEAVAWRKGVTNTIHYVKLTNEQRNRSYGPILKNKALLRDLFLDSGAEYFLLLGGDNPPPRDAIRRLIKADADVAMGTCYQRPGQDTTCGVYPLVWKFLWLKKELNNLKFTDGSPVDKEVIEEMRMAWLNCPSLLNICYDPQWKKRGLIWDVAGGDGCALIKRKVLERIDWGTVPPDVYNSEDIYFMTEALHYGFSTACLTDLHIPHLHPSGLVY